LGFGWWGNGVGTRMGNGICSHRDLRVWRLTCGPTTPTPPPLRQASPDRDTGPTAGLPGPVRFTTTCPDTGLCHASPDRGTGATEGLPAPVCFITRSPDTGLCHASPDRDTGPTAGLPALVRFTSGSPDMGLCHASPDRDTGPTAGLPAPVRFTTKSASDCTPADIRASVRNFAKGRGCLVGETSTDKRFGDRVRQIIDGCFRRLYDSRMGGMLNVRSC